VNAPILEVRDLKKHYPGRAPLFRPGERPVVHAVDGISFAISPGEAFGLIGESGCGKSTTVRMLLGLERPTEGDFLLDGVPITHDARSLRAYRRCVQAVFQDPYSSLSPRMKVGDIVAEPLITSGVPRGDIKARVAELLDVVGLPAEAAERRPHEFSGGQRQRIAIARGIAINPRLLILDEPVSALDVSIRAQILNLLKRLQQQVGLSYLFISHDLDVVAHMCRNVAVMYLGRIVESGPIEAIRRDPQHPYTKALFSAVLPPHPDRITQRIRLRGPIPSPLNPPSGCRFRTRCPIAQPLCAEVEPQLEPTPTGSRAACHFVEHPGSPAPAAAIKEPQP
jgi:oligopeptide/dipeptide ABC transporter ATP-binding protein